MARVNVDRELEDEGFHPCLNCGAIESIMNWETGIWDCCNCGEPIISPPAKKERVRLVNRKGFEDGWE